ncbi:MAG TPA: molybdopterin cofactor-binding domain-containing protein, partial [Cyclobacteriaceae bacterium]
MVSRRKFIQLTSMAGSFLAIGYVSSAGRERLVARSVSDRSGVNLNQFILIGTDNSIVLFNHRPEMGQGTYQSVPMILAEELEVDIDKVEIKPSAANSALYGSQMVVGSRSIQSEFEKLRKMGAAAREMLRQAAANTWNTSVEQCRATKG